MKAFIWLIVLWTESWSLGWRYVCCLLHAKPSGDVKLRRRSARLEHGFWSCLLSPPFSSYIWVCRHCRWVYTLSLLCRSGVEVSVPDCSWGPKVESRRGRLYLRYGSHCDIQCVAIKRPLYKNFNIFKTAWYFCTKFSAIITEKICYRLYKFCAILCKFAEMMRLLVFNALFSSEL